VVAHTARIGAQIGVELRHIIQGLQECGHTFLPAPSTELCATNKLHTFYSQQWRWRREFQCCPVNTWRHRQSGTLNSTSTPNFHHASLHCMPMSDEWDSVDSWLEDVLNSQRLRTSSPRPASISYEDDIAQQIAPSSPLSTIWLKGLPCTSPSALKSPSLKRKRSNSYNYDTMPSPRKRLRTQDDQLSITSALGDIKLLPTALSRSSSPTKVKANSPIHEPRETYRFASPSLRYTISIDENTPQSVIDIIHELPRHGVGIIPGSLKV
jgi:hypothetical protein